MLRGSRLVTFVTLLTAVFALACGRVSGDESGSLVAEAAPAGTPTAATRAHGADIRPVRTRYTEEREPCTDRNPLRSVHFGDLHVHTSRSLDAGIQDTRTTPWQAYLFAKGERIGIQPWSDAGGGGLDHMLPVSPATTLPGGDGKPSRTLQLGRPLDFAMVSDHAEFFGEVRICGEQGLYESDGWLFGWGRRGYLSGRCEKLRDDPLSNFVAWNFAYLGALPGVRQSDRGGIPRFEDVCGEGGQFCLDAARTTWQETMDAAEAAYDRTRDCDFTSFVGYEYTSTPVSENMHRNVVFRNANVPALPISYMEAKRPEILWAMLDEQCDAESGCESFTIPHNSNVSAARMFRRAVTRPNHSDFDAAYARMRQTYEPLIEIYQHKGDSECRIDSTDELCAFEKMPYNNLIADRFGGTLTSWPKRDSFVRHALGRGLELDAKLGVNPFRYGIIASTDTHLGTPGAVNEVGFPGHGGAGASHNEAAEAEDGDEPAMPEGLVDNIAFSGGGLAAVWAEENSRDFLFDSMQRRETYGTSGPRMVVRFFGGWDHPADMCEAVSWDPTAASLTSGPFVEAGYAAGVPMGGLLAAPTEEGAVPTFAVAALRDPGFATDDPASDLYERSTPLQQIHIVKGWLDENGVAQEQVMAVAGEPDPEAGVDLDTCEPHGVGADALCTVWRDESFDPAQRAFYYARVVENPTCRWSWMQCRDFEQASDVDLEVACKKPGSLPEGFRSCCKHESLAELSVTKLDKKKAANARAKRMVSDPLLQRPESYPETIQERAWTSPIWYRP